MGRGGDGGRRAQLTFKSGYGGEFVLPSESGPVSPFMMLDEQIALFPALVPVRLEHVFSVIPRLHGLSDPLKLFAAAERLKRIAAGSAGYQKNVIALLAKLAAADPGSQDHIDPAIDLPGLEPIRDREADLEVLHRNGVLFRGCASEPMLLRRLFFPQRLGSSVKPVEIPLRVIDLDRHPQILRNLVASLTLMITNTTAGADKIRLDSTSNRDGSLGEAMTEAYFASLGYQPIGGTYWRERRGGSNAEFVRFARGQGIDHVLRGPDGTYVVAESKSFRAEEPIDLQKRFTRSKRTGVRAFSRPYIVGHIDGALGADRGLSTEVRRELKALAARGELRRIAVVTAVLPPGRDKGRWLPDPRALVASNGHGRWEALADEVVIIRAAADALYGLPDMVAGARLYDRHGIFVSEWWMDDTVSTVAGRELPAWAVSVLRPLLDAMREEETAQRSAPPETGSEA